MLLGVSSPTCWLSSGASCPRLPPPLSSSNPRKTMSPTTPRPPPPSAIPPPPPMPRPRPRTSVTCPVSSRAPRRKRIWMPYLQVAPRKRRYRHAEGEREVRGRPEEERRARRVGAAERPEPQHEPREPGRVEREPVERVLVQRVEREEPPGRPRDLLEARRVDHVADLAEKARDEAAAEDHQRADAVRRRREEDGAEDADRGHDHDGGRELEPRREQPVGRPAARPPRDPHEREVDAQHVEHAHG